MPKDDKKNNVNGKELNNLNNGSEEIIKHIATGTYQSPIDNAQRIDKMELYIDTLMGVDNKNIDKKEKDDKIGLGTFLLQSLKDSGEGTGAAAFNFKNTSNPDAMIEDLFNTKNSSIFEVFNERFRNKSLLFKDLEIISDQLVELTEALNTTRDDILCADNIGAEISRSLNFSTDTAQREKYDDLIEDVKRIEKEYKLNHKVREHIVLKTLKYGEYYVYVIPKSKLFEKAQYNKNSKIKSLALESYELEGLCESMDIDRKSDNINFLNEELQYQFNVCNDEIPLPLVENTNTLSAMLDIKKFNKLNPLMKYNPPKKDDKLKDAKMNKELEKTKKADMNLYKNGKPGIKDNNIGFSDGVISNKGNRDIDDWSDVKGCYIKLLDPKKVIPVKIMDYIIGYYYIEDVELDSVNHRCSRHNPGSTLGRGGIFGNMLNKSQKERTVVDVIANGIVKSFNKKYLEDNEEFKELIINSLLYNDMYKRKIHYQFIPADHICRFTINEDEEGNGVSMLYGSLFYAKLYLSLLIFNMITHLDKSQDTKINYVKQSGIDKDIINKCNSIARQIKSKQISIADLMDYSSIYGKIGTGRDVFMPVGESGERGIEFDVISGQQVDMQNDLMENLKQSYINGTGVPSVIMNYINEADYAKTLVMANAKQLRRVMNYQESFNESITMFYRKILLYCSDMDESDIENFYYTLQKPKALPNTNLADTIGYGDQILDTVIKNVYGENQQDSDERLLEKDLFRKDMARNLLSMLPWEEIDKSLDRVKLEIAEKKATGEFKSTEDTDDNSGY